MAIPIIVSGTPDPWKIIDSPTPWPGMILLVGVAFLLYRVAIKPLTNKS